MKRRFLSMSMALFMLLTLLPTVALAVDEPPGLSYNPAYTVSELNTQIISAVGSLDNLFYATDAYGNRLGDEITIARGGSFFLRFKVPDEVKTLMNQGVGPLPATPPTTYTNLNQLFGNVGWNLETITGVIAFENEVPTEENGWSGGIHIDTLENAGRTIYLDFYISPKVNMGENLPVNWGTMSQDYVIKKVIKVTVEDSDNYGGNTENGVSAEMAKPIPEGYDLTVTPFDSTMLSEKAGYNSGNVENYGVDFTMKNGDTVYPVTNNSVDVEMALPEALEGCAEYAVSYLDPVSGKIKPIKENEGLATEGDAIAATIAGGVLSFTTPHFSQLIITGSGGAKIEETAYANLDAAAAAAQADDTIEMQVDGMLRQSTNHVAGVTINRNGHTLKIAGGSHIFEVTTDDLAPHRVVASSEGVYTVSKDTHAVVFETNGGSTVAPSTVTCEELVGQPASPTRSGYVFQGWYTDSALTTQYDFTAPVTSDITLYAKWTQTSSGGGSTPSSPVPVSSDEGSVNVSATVSGGTATISVSDSQLNQIASGNETDTGIVKLDLSSLKADKAVIPAKLVTATADATGSQGLEVAFSTASVALDEIALESVGNNRVTVSAETVKATALTAAQAEMLGDQADTAVILDVNVLVNGVKTSAFGGGLITVRIPYTPKEGEDASKLVVWYLKDDGTIEPMNGKHNESTKYFEFTTTHLSTYVLTAFPFSDVAPDSYYYGAAAWAVANGTTEGTTLTTFSPNVVCTRSQTMTFLWRTSGSPEPTSTMNPFTDVSPDAYYYKAVLWAVEKGITLGTNAAGTTFSPNNTCTRGQMVTLLYRYAGSPAVTGNDPFTDVAASDYYSDAVNWASDKGVTRGTNVAGTTFSPKDDCTRGQIVTFLYRYLVK